jgi:hypothetical protein
MRACLKKVAAAPCGASVKMFLRRRGTPLRTTSGLGTLTESCHLTCVSLPECRHELQNPPHTKLSTVKLKVFEPAPQNHELGLEHLGGHVLLLRRDEELHDLWLAS